MISKAHQFLALCLDFLFYFIIALVHCCIVLLYSPYVLRQHPRVYRSQIRGNAPGCSMPSSVGVDSDAYAALSLSAGMSICLQALPRASLIPALLRLLLEIVVSVILK
jgi:hypothetical protein